MTDFIFDAARGRTVAMAENAALGNGYLYAVPILADGYPSDEDPLQSAGTLAAALALVSESPMGRVTPLNLTVNVDPSQHRAVVSSNPITWEAASGGEVIAVLFAYGDFAASTDEEYTPLSKHAVSFTPSGADVVLQITPPGFIIAGNL